MSSPSPFNELIASRPSEEQRWITLWGKDLAAWLLQQRQQRRQEARHAKA